MKFLQKIAVFPKCNIGFLSVCVFIFGAINPLKAHPLGHYNAAIGKTGAELQLILHNINKGHNKITHDEIWTDLLGSG